MPLTFGKITATTLAITMLLSSTATTLERTAVKDTFKADVQAIEMRMDTKLTVLQTLLDRLITCNTRGRLYSSNASAPGRDADGCVAVPSGSLTYANTYTRTGNSNSPTYNHTACALSRSTFNTSEDNHGHTCRVVRTGGGFQLRSTVSANSHTTCEMICFDAN